MLEKILTHYGPIKWHKINKDFEEYFREKGPSNFYRINATFSCCESCARSKEGVTFYDLYQNIDTEGDSCEQFPVPRKYDRGKYMYIIFEFDKNNVLHCWVHPKNRGQLSKDALRTLDRASYNLDKSCWQDKSCKFLILNLLKNEIYMRLSKSKNPEIQKKAIEIGKRITEKRREKMEAKYKK